MRLTIPEDEILQPGHLACQGCAAVLSIRYALKALGPKTVMVIPACCVTVIDGPFPYSSYGVPIYHIAFAAAAAAASGIKAGLLMRGDKETQVMAWAGDGGTFDIGIQALSGAAERNDDIIYVCYDNEAYMNTGIQRSSATPKHAWTTTTPARNPKEEPKKDIMAIMVAHKIPYAATATVAYPEDMIRKFKKAREIRGLRFFHILAPCPVGWRVPPEYTIQLSRLAVQTRYFPLYEVENGENWRLTMKVPKPKPVAEFLKLQGRFRHLTDEQIAEIQAEVDRRWEDLMSKVSQSNEGDHTPAGRN